jgi:lysophospholipase L1-like esterase
VEVVQVARAFLAYYHDIVLSANGVPVAGATVTLYPVSSFASGVLPSGGSGLPTPVATAITDGNGNFIFAGIPPDDYHQLVTYIPYGGSPNYIWSYFVPVLSAELARRGVSGARAAGMPRALARLAAGASVTVVCMGDDVTVGYNATGTVAGSWVALLAAQLAAAYPAATVVREDPSSYTTLSDGPIPSWNATTVQTGSGTQTITVVNAGVNGDTVLRALRRFANLTASWPAVDVVIASFGLWESTSGGAQQYVGAADFQAQLEAFVNITRTFTQAEVLLCTPAVNPASSGFSGYASAVRAVAARVRTDLADMAQLWLDNYVSGGTNDGYGSWLNTSLSAVFPTDAGHAAMAGELVKHFQIPTIVPFEGSGFGAGKVWELIRVPYSSNQVAMVGSGWTAHSGFQGSTLNSSGGTEYVTSHTGDTVTIQGRFVDVSMLCRRFSDCGQVGVQVDGGASVTIDLYRGYPTSTSDLSDANGASAPQDRVLLAHGLTDAVHTVVVTELGTKNVSSSGYNWRFEGFELGRWRKQGYEVEANDAQQRIQRGYATVTFNNVASASVAVTFPVAFTEQTAFPIVVATSEDINYITAVTVVTDTGFTVWMARRDGTSVTSTPQCQWIALG